MPIKTIHTNGIAYIEPLSGSGRWYFGTDCTSGDLYEAEELYRSGHRFTRNRLIFVHTPDGQVFEPIPAVDGRYFGRPVFDCGRIVILLVDFFAGEIRLFTFDGAVTEQIMTLPLSEVEDCYNLMPHTSPLCLTRQTGCRFQIVWPERADFEIEPTDSFCFREGDRLYFSRWFEDPDYREEVVVRGLDGAVVEQFRGSLTAMPDGQMWALD